SGRADVQPRWRTSGPRADGSWSFWILHLRHHGRWRNHLSEERRQNLILSDQNEVIDRRCIGDNDHSPRTLRSAAASSANSFGVTRSSVTLCRLSRASA